MPLEKYPLEVGGPERLELSREAFMSEITVRLDDNVIGVIANDEELKKGRTFKLHDGSSLTVQLVKTLFKEEVRVVRDGQLLPDSASNPVNRFWCAYISVYVAGAFNFIVGTGGLIYQHKAAVAGLGFMLVLSISGATVMYLGYLVKQKSMRALALASLIFLATSTWTYKEAFQKFPLEKWDVTGHVILLIGMIQGFGAIRAINKFERSKQDDNA